jgi:hypothetical protein
MNHEALKEYWTNPSDKVIILDATQEEANKFGHHFGSELVLLNKEHIEALFAGKMLAWDDGEYSTFVVLEQDESNL